MDEDRQKKIFLMKVGIASLTAVILVLWIFNLKNVWRDSSETASLNSNVQWTNLSNDLAKTLGSVKQQLSQIDAAKQAQNQVASNTLITDLVKKTQTLGSSTTAVTMSNNIEPVSTTTITVTSNVPTTTPAIKSKNKPK